MESGPLPDSHDSTSRFATLGYIGPDVIVAEVSQIQFFGLDSGLIAALSIGTIACNVGDQALNWFANDNRHPVIAQHMYRLTGGRFEQIGMSWLKHGFFAENQSYCGSPEGCSGDPVGTHLGAGCSDPYSSGLNGQQGNLGPRGSVNAHLGSFPYPYSAPFPAPVVGRRLQVHLTDILPSLNPNANYFVEAHYVTHDDASAGNQNNNASHRPLRITGGIGSLVFTLLDSTQRQRPAIRAWRDYDPAVVETEVQVPGEGLFILAAKAVDLGDGFWSYEYAIQNLNSDRSADFFRVAMDPTATTRNIGFHDVDYHSGDPFAPTDWTPLLADRALTWSAASYATNPNANALRWGTLYNFRFETDRPPASTTVRLGLFKPGGLGWVDAVTIGPLSPPPDCNRNGIDDPCDLACGVAGGPCDLPGCGSSVDLNSNGVPDECDPDCNHNGTPDELDLSSGGSLDCNANTAPDECEPDADGDGAIDDCDPCPLDPLNDADHDGYCVPEDGCPDDPFKTSPERCGCGRPETDVDGDRIADCVDNCRLLPNPNQADFDADGVGDVCDICLFLGNGNQSDLDGDGKGDVCDPCPLENPDDEDGDGLCFPQDLCPTDPTKISPGACGCLVSEIDTDDDGTADCIDECPADPSKSAAGACGCGVAETDSDQDDVPDCVDQCIGLDDRLDFDADGVPDCVENVPAVSQWGLFVLALLLLTMGKRAFGFRRVVSG